MSLHQTLLENNDNGQPPAASTVPSTPSEKSALPNSTFEFIRRKKWADVLLAALPTWICVLSPDQETIIFASSAIETLTGVAPQSATGRSIYDFFHRPFVLMLMCLLWYLIRTCFTTRTMSSQR